MAWSQNTTFTSKVTAITAAFLNALNTVMNKVTVLETSVAADAGKNLTIDSAGDVALTDSQTTDNLIWNPDFTIWQRGTSFTTAIGSDFYTADAWQMQTAALSTGVVTVTQSTTVPTQAESGMLSEFSLKMEATTVIPSVAATTHVTLTGLVEGPDVAVWAQEEVTVSFWCRSNQTGTYALGLGTNVGGLFKYVTTFTVDVADTWELKTKQITLNPAGDVTRNVNEIGLLFFITPVAGTSADVDTDDIWDTQTEFGSPSQDRTWGTTVNDDFYIAQVKINGGSNRGKFHKIPFTQEYLRAQRIFYKTFPYATTPAQNAGVDGALVERAANTGDFTFNVVYPVPMAKTNLTVTTYNPSAANAEARNITDSTDEAVSEISDSDKSVHIRQTATDASHADDEMALHVTVETSLT